MKKYLIFVLGLLFPTIALADVAIPALGLVSRISETLLLIPVILIEFWYLSSKIKKVSLSYLFGGSTLANLTSTLIGFVAVIPIGFLATLVCILMPVLPFILSIYYAYHLIKERKQKNVIGFCVSILLSVLITLCLVFGFTSMNSMFQSGEELAMRLFWISEGKGKDSRLTLLPTFIIDCIISYWVEYKVLYNLLKNKLIKTEIKDLKKYVLMANIYSYLFLGSIIVLLILL
ncbi:MAG: hypothetical protein J6Y85_03435 [Alphaproteobacteria bacterium]|nr:hypothetical protein [Alphaproteobacteria bacterium]